MVLSYLVFAAGFVCTRDLAHKPLLLVATTAAAALGEIEPEYAPGKRQGGRSVHP